MGTGFFGQIASHDPLAQALDLPGAHKLDQQNTRDSINETSASANLPYANTPATLAGANKGYAAKPVLGMPPAQPLGAVPGQAPGQQRQWGVTTPYQS